MTFAADFGLTDEEYSQLVEQVREVVNAVLPKDSTVLVASMGDETFLHLAGRRTWHFPKLRKGKYPRYDFVDSAAAITQLVELRDLGAEYFVVPRTAFWWLEHYEGFSQHLARYRLVARQYHVGLIFELTAGRAQ
jgi:hypothetical protein